MSTVAMEDVPANLPALLDRVAAGDEVTITRDGYPAATLTMPKGVPVPGRCKGMLTVNEEVPEDIHLHDFAGHM